MHFDSYTRELWLRTVLHRGPRALQHERGVVSREGEVTGRCASRPQVDLIHVDGPDFAKVDNRVLALQLVDVGLTEAVFFNAAGQVAIPSDYLRKKNIIIQVTDTYAPA